MKAAVLYELNRPLRIMEFPVPEPGEGQVLVRMAYSGICHTQLLEIQGKNTSGPINPNLLGHEGSGVVEKVGKHVKKVRKGDHVVLSWIKGSGANVLPKPFYHNGTKVNVGFVTTFNEYSIASENRVTKISRKMPLKEAALIGCAVATGAGAVLNNARVEKGKSAMVIGVGGVGINMLHMAAVEGCNPVIAVDISGEKLEFSKKFGATHIINSRKNDIEKEARKICPNGVDYAFDTVGRKETMEFAYNIVSRFTGKAVLCGVPNPLNIKIEIDPFPMYFGRKISGTGGGESKPDEDFKRYCKMFLDGKLKLDCMVTHVVGLDDINIGIRLMKNGEACRVLVDLNKKL